jgi:5-methylcytosine-specific restriction endonuclease McrA
MNYIQKYLKYHNIGEQDILMCAFGDGRALDVHHIVFRSQGGTDDIENLIALCRSCHDRAHFKKQPYLTKEELCTKNLR